MSKQKILIKDKDKKLIKKMYRKLSLRSKDQKHYSYYSIFSEYIINNYLIALNDEQMKKAIDLKMTFTLRTLLLYILKKKVVYLRDHEDKLRELLGNDYKKFKDKEFNILDELKIPYILLNHTINKYNYTYNYIQFLINIIYDTRDDVYFYYEDGFDIRTVCKYRSKNNSKFDFTINLFPIEMIKKSN